MIESEVSILPGSVKQIIKLFLSLSTCSFCPCYTPDSKISENFFKKKEIRPLWNVLRDVKSKIKVTENSLGFLKSTSIYILLLLTWTQI